jgi:hypothetical protein
MNYHKTLLAQLIGGFSKIKKLSRAGLMIMFSAGKYFRTLLSDFSDYDLYSVRPFLRTGLIIFRDAIDHASRFSSSYFRCVLTACQVDYKVLSFISQELCG